MTQQLRDAPDPASPPTIGTARGMAETWNDCRLRDPVGHYFHTAFALLYVLLLPLATAPKDIAWAALAVMTVARLPRIHRCFKAPCRDRLIWLLLAWAVWHGISVLWSADRAAGLDELGAFRVVLTPLLLWPVLDHAALFIGAFLVGVVGANLVQLTQQFHWFGQEPGFNGRLDGWLHAVHTGAICAAAVCWHLSAILKGKRWLRWLSLIGAAAAVAGLLGSGSRGPWLGIAATVPLGLLLIGLTTRRLRRAVLVIALVGVVGAGIAWVAYGDFVTTRIHQATDDIRKAIDGDFHSDVGERLARWAGAWKVFVGSPMLGVGAGGFGHAIAELGYSDVSPEGHHAHSVYMHVLACTGLPGVLLLAGVVVMSVRRVFRCHPEHVYSIGTILVLITWLIGAVFDAYHLNGNMFGLFTLIVALTLPYRSDDSAGIEPQPTLT